MVFDRKAYMKEYRKNNKERIKEQRKEYNKEYYQNNKEHKIAQSKEWYENNKEHKKEYDKEYSKEYRQTEKCQMIFTIANWERRGVIYPDMKELYYIVKMTTHCHYCWVELIEGNFGNHKCLDHNHETGEPRGVICQTCNLRDVFKNC